MTEGYVRDWDSREAVGDVVRYVRADGSLVREKPRCPRITKKTGDRCPNALGAGHEVCWAHNPEIDHRTRGRWSRERQDALAKGRESQRSS